jgi:hypothetical protein
MYATVRPSEGIGMVRSEEVTRKGRELAAEPAAGCGAGGSPQKSLLQFATETGHQSETKEDFQGGLS